MRTTEHLTKEQLAAYAAARSPLARTETDEIEKHLLQCAICRAALPAPTAKQFWSALLDETEIDDSFESKSSSPARSPFSNAFVFFRQPLALGALALIFAAGVSLVIWLGAARESNPATEVTQTVETPKSVKATPAAGENLPVSTGKEPQKNEKAENSPPPPARPKQPDYKSPAETETPKKSERAEDRELAALLENTPPVVSSLRPNGRTTLRGNTQNSDSTPSPFNLLAPVGETVLETMPEFRWAKLPNAESYRISILDADFNEVATAEISANSFKPDKPLKSGAKYLWRVEATTENGKIVAPRPPQPPAVFRVAPATAESRIASLRKNKNDRLKLAVFYAREGMLDSASCALKEILAKNPKHKTARRLLARVELWKKENNATAQRCGPSAK